MINEQSKPTLAEELRAYLNTWPRNHAEKLLCALDEGTLNYQCLVQVDVKPKIKLKGLK